MAKYLDKWKDLFPDTVGGTTRPSEAVSDQEEFNTDGFPQFIAQDPVNYALQNAFLKQFLSNDAWLWVKQKQANQALDDHKVDTQAHAKGISGNAGSATKLANARTINLSGAVTADAASFDGTADATINVKTLDASKLKGTTSVSTTGNAATATKVVANAANGASANIAEARIANNDVARIRVSGADNAGELALETADDGTEPIVARQYTGVFGTVARTAAILDANGNTSFPGTVVAPKFTGALNGNAATASKLLTPRTISLTGNATGAAAFDGSGDISINTTVNESKHAGSADKLKTDSLTETSTVARPVWLSYEQDNTRQVTTTNLTYTPSTKTLTAANFKGHLAGNADTATHAAAATTVNATAPNGGAADLVFGIMANDDSARIRVGGSTDNGWLEIATSDNGNEPIYARQYTGGFRQDDAKSIAHEAVLLDGNGNTKFPKNVTAASFTGPLNGNASTATTASMLQTTDGNGAIDNGKFYWIGKDGQPMWLWGSNTKPSETYVYNPSNFHVAAANKLADESGNNHININSTTDSWSVIGSNPGNWLKSIRTNPSAPPYSIGNYSAAVAFGGGDTKGIITHAYDNPTVKFAGGNGSTAVWKFSIQGGSNNEVYNLNNFPTKTGGGASGTWNISVSGNAATATTANALNGIINREPATNNHAIIPGANARDYCEFHEIGAVWNFIKTYNEGSTTVASIRSDGFHGNVVGNAATATNADKLDGYHASDLFRHLGGNQTPVITDIFDRAGTIDMTTMNAADKATHKANINKAANATQNIWNTDTGMRAYGGDYDMTNGYGRGSLKLTQSYKNFDKILVVGIDDKGYTVHWQLWDVWDLAQAFANSFRFFILRKGGDYWTIYGNTKHGNYNQVWSTDTVWSCQDQDCGIVAIYGIKF